MFAYVKMGGLDKFPFLKDIVWCGLDVFDGPTGGRPNLVNVGIMDGKPQAASQSMNPKQGLKTRQDDMNLLVR